MSSPYEPPAAPELHIQTDKHTVQESVMVRPAAGTVPRSIGLA